MILSGPNRVNYSLQFFQNVKQQIRRSKEARSFALTLNLYSPKAYNFIRQELHNILPSPSVIRKWFSNIN